MACWSALPPRSRGSVCTGVAIPPEGSLAARPTRTLPTSTPSRTPVRIRSATCRDAFADRVLDACQGLADLGRVGATTLGHVVLAAAAPAEGLGRDLDQVTGPDAPLPGRVVRGHDDHRPVLGHAGHRDDAGAVVAEASPQVEGEPAQVVGADAGAGVVADEAHPEDVARAGHQRPG